MLRHVHKIHLTLLSALAAAALVSGCGGGSSAKISCGEGTKKVGNNCVLDSTPVTCAEGTTLQDNQCVPNVACGPGTSADSTGQCVPSAQLTCAPGTKLAGDTCVADTDVVCKDGTHVQDGKCVADLLCGDGTTAKDGECLSDSQVLAAQADVDEGSDENDPNFGGTAQTVTLPAASDTLTIAGGFDTPQDKDGDGYDDQDFDVYAFDGQPGDYLRIETIDNGASSTSFVLRGPNGYVRRAPTNAGHGERKVLLPYEGTYSLTVGPAANLANGDLGAQGGDKAGYVVSIENLGPFDTSTAATVDATTGDSATGHFAELSDNLVAVHAPAGSTVRLAFPEVGVDVRPAVILLDGSGTVLGEQQVDARGVVDVPANDDDLQVLLDYVSLHGDRDAYTAQATVETPDSLGETLSGTKRVTMDQSTWTIPAGTAMYLTFDVDLKDDGGNAVPGLIETIMADSMPDTLEMRVYDPNHQPVEGFDGLSGFYASVGGTYTLELYNADRLRPVELTALSFASYVPQNLGSFDTTTHTSGDHTFSSVPVNTMKFVTFETTEALTADLSISQGTAKTLRLSLLAGDTGYLAGDTGRTPAIEGMPLMQPGRYIGVVLGPPGGAATSVDVALNTRAAATEAAEPNGTNASAVEVDSTNVRLVGTLTGGPMRDHDVYKLTFRINQPSLVHFNVEPMGSDSVVVKLSDANGAVYDAVESSGSTSVGAVLQPGTDYYVDVYRTSGYADLPYLASATVDTNVDATLETEGNDTSADAASVSVQENPATLKFGGTLAGPGDADWYAFDMPNDAKVKVSLAALGGLRAPSADLNVELYEDDGSGNLTQVPLQDMMDLTAGTKYLKVSGGTASGYANTYLLKALVISAIDLGQLPNDVMLERTNTLDSTGSALFMFTVGSTLPGDGSRKMAFWSNVKVEVMDSDLQPMFTARQSQEFNFPNQLGTGYATTSLAAGTYFARISGPAGATWHIRAGILASRTELELLGTGVNNAAAGAQDLGQLSNGGETTIFGAVARSDADDYYSFSVPDLAGDGSTQHVVIETLSLGEKVDDLNTYLLDSTTSFLDSVTAPFRVLDEQLAPGVYYVDVYDSATGTGCVGDYLLRIKLK